MAHSSSTHSSSKTPEPSFYFHDHRLSKTYSAMSDDQFATFAALSSERSKGNAERTFGGFRDRFYFKSGKEIKELMCRYGAKEENVENVLHNFEETDWIEVGEIDEIGKSSGEAVVIFDDIMEDDWCDLDAQHDNGLYIQVRSYVLDKFEEFCPNNKRPSCSGND